VHRQTSTKKTAQQERRGNKVLTAFGAALMEHMAERDFTLSELAEKAAALGFYLDDDTLFEHMIRSHTLPQGAKYCRGPAAMLALNDEDAIRLGVAYLFDK
jgi:hypothetical protein